MSTVLPPLLHSDTLPHPLLITTPFSPKEEQELLVHILGEKHRNKIVASTHPDVHIYSPDEKSDLYSIATVRALIQEMGLPPFEAARKVFFLRHAEKMLPTSSNALLKTLEEPSDDSFVVLFSEHPSLLLPTITSRLHRIASPSSSLASEEVAPFLEMVKQKQWPELLEAVTEIDDARADPFLHGVLQWAAQQGSPSRFGKVSFFVSQAQTALAHHVKLRTVLVHLFLELEGDL